MLKFTLLPQLSHTYMYFGFYIRSLIILYKFTLYIKKRGNKVIIGCSPLELRGFVLPLPKLGEVIR